MMHLFAQASDGTSTSIMVTVVGMVLASLGAAVTAIMSYLTNRDKLRFDARHVQMERDIEYLKLHKIECEAELKEARDEHEHLYQKMLQGEEERRRLNKDLEDMRGSIERLKAKTP